MNSSRHQISRQIFRVQDQNQVTNLAWANDYNKCIIRIVRLHSNHVREDSALQKRRRLVTIRGESHQRNRKELKHLHLNKNTGSFYKFPPGYSKTTKYIRADEFCGSLSAGFGLLSVLCSFLLFSLLRSLQSLLPNQLQTL